MEVHSDKSMSTSFLFCGVFCMYVSHYFLNRSKNGNIEKGRKKRLFY